MTKHNGKARKSGANVGGALIAASKKGKARGGPSNLHTTDIHGGGNMQSVLERNDLDELMAMAELADRDFTAERSNVVVISSGTASALDEERAAEERAAAEDRNRHRLRLPRRPLWDDSTTPEQLDTQERNAFVEWRRELAQLEEQERLVLTPFEKNLEVWRQLWRVLERSDIVVQVVDARDPLLYRCEDLEAYARELHATKTSLLLLNKADLLPEAVRERWADYMDKIGMPYAFWSAAAVNEEHSALRVEANEIGIDWRDLAEQRRGQDRLKRLSAEAALMAAAPDAAAGAAAVTRARRVRVLGEDELCEWLEERAREAVEAAGPGDARYGDKERRYMVGLVGYPNVGKSSTINALFGAKKTAVAPTPGKTKHFQTLIISQTLCLCDCPGLVMPKFARSKAEMVAAGVIPIDRLTEIRSPVEVVAERCGRGQIEQLYGFKLAPPPAHTPTAPPTAQQVLRALSTTRGWVVGSGLPDENRSGRLILRDYTAGRLLHCTLPPDSHTHAYIPLIHDPHTLQPLHPTTPPPTRTQRPTQSTNTNTLTTTTSTAAEGSLAGAQSGSQTAADAVAAEQQGVGLQGSSQPARVGSDGLGLGLGLQQGLGLGLGDLDEADLDLLAGELEGLQVEGAAGAAGSAAGAARRAEKPRRAEHKFQKKPSRSKGDRGQGRDAGGYDGSAATTGKKGGLVRVGVY